MAIYSDLNSITPTDQPLVENVASVYQSINTILNTPKGSRIFNPEFGSDLETLLFEPMDAITELQIIREVIEAIELWEDRVTLDYSQTKVVADIDKHTYDLTLSFKIRGFGDQIFEQRGTLSSGGNK